MATTPPPPGRVHTPPPPLHGPRYDAYEPYSPRRSARVSAQRNHNRSSPEPGPSRAASSAHSRFTITSTPAARKSKTMRITSSQTLSPPSSPELHSKRTTPLQKQFLSARDPSAITSHSTSETEVSKPFTRDTPNSMLPTPNKTPNKRTPAAITSTARILNFRPSGFDTILPNPHKQRKSRLTLDSFDEMYNEQEPPVEIYTDSQDRVPDLEPTSDNPFVGPKQMVKAPTARKSRNTKRDLEREGDEADMEEAVRNNEGIVYVFRGKKIFRRFESPASNESGEASPRALHNESTNLKRQAGAAAQRPFTRSSLKPRLLFPSDDQRQEREMRLVDEDEEAVTDIELNDATDEHDPDHNDRVTPANKDRFMSATPRTSKVATGSTKRRSTRFLSSLTDVAESPDAETDESPSTIMTIPIPQTRAKKVSPFDSWQRTKSLATVPQSKKRAISDGDEVSVGKRTRSSKHE